MSKITKIVDYFYPMKKQSILFLGSKPIGYACLQYLIEQSNTLQLDILGILSNDNATFDKSLSIKELATANHIPIFETLADMPKADFICSVQYHEILKKENIAQANILAFNLHMAPLPEYRGCNQFSFAILDDAQEFGCTIHQMDERIDHGDILFEARFPIPNKCWVHQLYQLTYDASLQLFKTSLEQILKRNYVAIPQETYLATRGTSMHYRKEIQTIKNIDLHWDADKMDRHIRATYMPGFEPPYTWIGDQKIYFSPTWQ